MSAGVLVVAALEQALTVLWWIVLVQALLTWIPGLVSGSGWLASLDRAAGRITEPLLAPIRQRMPAGAAVDFSPIVLFILIWLAKWLLGRMFVT